jgi:hypothetical protein
MRSNARLLASVAERSAAALSPLSQRLRSRHSAGREARITKRGLSL